MNQIQRWFSRLEAGDVIRVNKPWCRGRIGWKGAVVRAKVLRRHFHDEKGGRLLVTFRTGRVTWRESIGASGDCYTRPMPLDRDLLHCPKRGFYLGPRKDTTHAS